MLYKSLLLCGIYFLFYGVSMGQNVRGVVTTDEDIILPGAQVWLAGYEQSAVYANKLGDYQLPWPEGQDSLLLLASYVGYQMDTTLVFGSGYHHLRLRPMDVLNTIVVEDRRAGQYLSNLTPVKTEVISSAELAKGACCDLAGCFNTNASVQSAVTNVVTNTKELRILGLGGVYNQILLDGFPLIYGSSYTYGMSTLPGPFIENIYISKGANSILQGWEGISGQVNVETKDPNQSPRYFGNMYINSFGEKQFNAFTTLKHKKVKNLLAIHAVLPANEIDRDDDQFLDLPLLRRISVYNRTHWGDPGEDKWSSSLGIRWVGERRIGGQRGFEDDRDKGSDQIYGQAISFSQPEMWVRLTRRMNERNRMVAFASAQYHDQDSWYGILNYQNRQVMANTTIQWERESASGNTLRMGVSGRYLHITEDLDYGANPLALPQGGVYERQDNIGGVFAEQIRYYWDDRLTWILGVRYDHHQKFGGRFTPRTLLKIDPNSHTSIRASLGYGWRMANIFTENVFLLASNRRVVFEGDLHPEGAWNAGINLNRELDLGTWTGRWGMDYYETRFTNQIFPDYNQAPDMAIIANYTGRSVSRAFQTDLDMNHPTGWQLKFAYNFLEVFRGEGADKTILPFNPTHKLLGVVSYAPTRFPFQVDAHSHWYGKQKLPNTSLNPEIYQRPATSETYMTITLQLTWRFKQWELYGGCENIFDFRQERPILGWEDPFGPYFDTALAWGPTRGREFYLGLRWRME